MKSFFSFLLQISEIIEIDDANESPKVQDVQIEIENKMDDSKPIVEDKTSEILGDVIDIDTTNTDNMNDQMRNELSVLELDEKSALPDSDEITLELSPKPAATMVVETISTDNDAIKQEAEALSSRLDLPIEEVHDIVQSVDDTVKSSIDSEIEKIVKEEKNIIDKMDTKVEQTLAPALAAAGAAVGTLSTIVATETVKKSIKESEAHHDEEKKGEKTTVISETATMEHDTDKKLLDPDDHTKATTNLDLASSDFSDDETDKAEKMYTESGVDETSRDEYERDEVSEVENFDMSSCGEDSLEAMYYSLRKNEIIMDRHHKEATTVVEKKFTEEERVSMTFPEKATDDLELAVREVSGNKKAPLRAMDSMDDVVLKKISSDSDELQMHVIPNSEIESSSSSESDGEGDDGVRIVRSPSEAMKKRSSFKEQSTVSTTDDEYIQRQESDDFDEVAAVAAAATVAALRYQTSQSFDSQSDDQQNNETDTFNEHEHHMEDMMPGNIQRKILASSICDGDSDSFDVPPTSTDGRGGRLTKDNFNVSTAFEHMIRNESITEESESTIESAATKIQAGARGFLTRRHYRQSGGSTSMSNENKRERHDELNSTTYSESFDKNSERTHSRQMLHKQTIDHQTVDSVDSEKMLGITEIKVEQRKNDTDNDNDSDGGGGGAVDSRKSALPDINIQGASEDSATAQRRLMLHRGDAMQRNSSAEQQAQRDGRSEKLLPTDEKVVAQTVQSNVKNDSPTKNCKFISTHLKSAPRIYD